MAVPSSGQLREYADIGVELGVAQSNVSLRGMSAIAGFSTPDAMSEFYGYSDNPFNNYDPFEDGSGLALYQFDGNANDVSGNYNGIATNPTYVTGLYNQATQTGNNSYVDIAALNTALTNNISLSFWVKSNTSQIANSDVFDLNHNSNGGMVLQRASSTQYLFAVKNVSTGSFGFSSKNVTIPIGIWTHLCLNVRSDGYNTVYINGVLDSSGSAMTGLSLAGKLMKIARYANLNERYFQGNFDQFRVFNRTLTSGEALSLYNESP